MNIFQQHPKPTSPLESKFNSQKHVVKFYKVISIVSSFDSQYYDKYWIFLNGFDLLVYFLSISFLCTQEIWAKPSKSHLINLNCCIESTFFSFYSFLSSQTMATKDSLSIFHLLFSNIYFFPSTSYWKSTNS